MNNTYKVFHPAGDLNIPFEPIPIQAKTKMFTKGYLKGRPSLSMPHNYYNVNRRTGMSKYVKCENKTYIFRLRAGLKTREIQVW